MWYGTTKSLIELNNMTLILGSFHNHQARLGSVIGANSIQTEML